MIKKGFSVAMLLSALSVMPSMAQERVIDMRADRVFIYPTRMELDGEETLLDILMMYPDLMQSGWDDMIGSYNLRIDNCPINGDTRILLSQIKAKYISRIQICDNTGVAKGTIGTGRVIDINMKRMEEGVHGVVGGQLDSDNLAATHAEARLGSDKTDVWATASYAYRDQDASIAQKQYLSAHMTNWFGPRDRLLTYFTQQYLDTKSYLNNGKTNSIGEKYMARARYFHNFNDRGTELLTVGSYQYSNTPQTSYRPDGTTSIDKDNTYLIGIVELNTPLVRNLSMMLGWEGDFSYTTYNSATANDLKYCQSNNDIYLQFNYVVGDWRFTLGDRVMFYHYGTDGDKTHKDTRNNIEASAIASVGKNSQVQAAYHRKFSNPSFAIDGKMTEEEWVVRKGNLKAAYIDEAKLAYTYSRKHLSLNFSSAYMLLDNDEDILKVNASAYYKMGAIAFTSGVNYYKAHGEGTDFATFQISPRLTLPKSWLISAQALVATKNKLLSHGDNTYLALQVNKNFGSRWTLSLDWHDITSSKYSACMGSVKYNF